MSVSMNLRRVRTQISSMERMLRLMRAEIESDLHDFGLGEGIEGADIPTDLARLLDSDQQIPLQEMSPYVNFSDGVWIGYEAEDQSVSCNVMSRVLRPIDRKEAGPAQTGLIVAPTFSTPEKTRWLTLETEVDIEAFCAAETVRLDMIGYFDISPTNRVPLPKTLKIILRITDRSGGLQDIDFYRAPLTTMALEYGCTLNLATKEKLQGSDVSRIVLIMLLPESGDYSFNLDFLSLRSLKG